MKKQKLSIRALLREVEENEQIENPTQAPPGVDPNQEMAPPQPAAPPETAPSEAPQQNQSALKDVIGSTISDITYEKVGSNGGKITIKTSSSHVPLVLSWVGAKATVSKQNGTVVMLSQEG